MKLTENEKRLTEKYLKENWDSTTHEVIRLQPKKPYLLEAGRIVELQLKSGQSLRQALESYRLLSQSQVIELKHDA